jgi:hypothetical protein
MGSPHTAKPATARTVYRPANDRAGSAIEAPDHYAELHLADLARYLFEDLIDYLEQEGDA